MENHIDPSTMLEFIEGLAAMAVLDQDGVYTYVSPGWERYTGHTAQEAIGRKVWEMVPDTHATEVFQAGLCQGRQRQRPRLYLLFSPL